MIIESILNALFGIFHALSSAINIEQLDPTIISTCNSVINYIETGIAIFSNYCNYGYLLILFGVILAVEAGERLYYFIMWVIKKIPMLNIK